METGQVDIILMKPHLVSFVVKKNKYLTTKDSKDSAKETQRKHKVNAKKFVN